MKRRVLKRDPDFIIGVDPSQRHNAMAVYDKRFGTFDWGEFGFVEDINGFELLLATAKIAWHGELAVLALIECPTWSGQGTKEVRSAALVWERELSRLFPIRQVFRVDPREWQRPLLNPEKGADTKVLSLRRVQGAMKLAVTSDHEADAVCIADYGRMLAKGVVA